MSNKTDQITRYCYCSEGMSDPPERCESPTGDVVDYWDHIESEKLLTDRIAQLEDSLSEMYTFFQPRAWGSADNKRDALNNAASVLGISQE